jgi:hypothetical protein
VTQFFGYNPCGERILASTAVHISEAIYSIFVIFDSKNRLYFANKGPGRNFMLLTGGMKLGPQNREDHEE